LRTTQGVLILCLGLILYLAYFTVRVMVNNGVDGLVVLSLILLAILGIGVLGALGSSSDE
jgi:hypothetical protein